MPTKELLKSATPQSLGYMLRCMGKDDALRRRFMVQEGIPRPVQSLILLPACRKQQREVRAPRRHVGCGGRSTTGQ